MIALYIKMIGLTVALGDGFYNGSNTVRPLLCSPKMRPQLPKRKKVLAVANEAMMETDGSTRKVGAV